MENVSGTFFERRSECGDRRCAENALRNFPDFSSVKIPEVFCGIFQKMSFPAFGRCDKSAPADALFPKDFPPVRKGTARGLQFSYLRSSPFGTLSTYTDVDGNANESPLAANIRIIAKFTRARVFA